MTPAVRGPRLAVPVLVAALAAACSSATTSNPAPSGTGNGSVAVNAGDKECQLARATLPAGRHTFEVTNTASQVTEVYIYAAGDRIMGEVENIGPSTKRTLSVDLPAGAYQVACKPGMVGDGVRTALTVTGPPASA